MAACCAGDASGIGAQENVVGSACSDCTQRVHGGTDGEQVQIARALLDVDDQRHSLMTRVNGSEKLPIRAAPALAARNISSP
jgi:hypothetical protein